MAYEIFLWIHTFSYIIWLAAFVASLFYYKAITGANGMPREKSLVQSERKISSMGAHIAVLGILISGGAMVSMPSGPQWGWFPFSHYPWLAIMQVIFVIILIIVFGISMPAGIKLKKLFRAAPEETVTDEQRGQWKKAWNISLIVYLLVVVNTVIGWWFDPRF
ncbi:MAG TPA: hypothetical protein VKA08_15890 [Balneolales bacterium]|nr:hypothetical protein [Balneolales bacterium]